MNTPLYLSWLVSECLKAGVKLKRASISHIDELFALDINGQPPDVVVNCSGLGAATIGGVQDKNMIPIRGQTVLVRNECGGSMYECSGMDDSKGDELVYIMQRAAGKYTFSFSNPLQ